MLLPGALLHSQIPDDCNVLLIICDDLNDFEGVFGGHPQAQTPYIDTFASEGVQFINAHSNAPICAPSRSSFMTGIYPHTSGNFAFAEWYSNPVLQNSKTLMQYMRDNGYGAYATGKIMHHRLTSEWTEYGNGAWLGPHAWDDTNKVAAFHPSIPAQFAVDEVGLNNSLFGRLSDVPTVNGYTGWWLSTWESAGPFNYVDENNRDDMVDERSRKWAINKLNELESTDPTGTTNKFFLAVGFSKPHSPFVAPDSYFDLFPVETLQLTPRIAGDTDDTHLAENAKSAFSGLAIYQAMLNSIGIDPEDDGTDYATEEDFLKAYLQAYLACVAYVDHQIGLVLEALDNSVYAGNTIVILTADHGYDWGEKETLAKNTLWETSTRVPLVIRAPGLEANAGKQVAHPVALIDLYPTVKDLCGLTGDTKKNANGADIDGHSLRPFLEDPENGVWDGPEIALSMVSTTGIEEESYKNFAVRSEEWRYIRYQNGAEELYDLSTDPYEFTNLAGSSDPDVEAMHAQLQGALFSFVPSLAVTPSNALQDPHFEWLNESSEPDPATSPWFTVDEANVWSFRRDNAIAYDGNNSLNFNQRWDVGSVAQNLDLLFDSNNIYTCSFWMRSRPQETAGNTDTTVEIELYTSPTQGGTYTKRGTLAVAQNSAVETWERFSGTLDASDMSAYNGEYIQFRVTKPNANTVYLINVDNILFDGFPRGSFQQWAFAKGINKSTTRYDLDRDGLVNLMEYAIGGLPDDAASRGYTPRLEHDGSGLIYTYPRRKDTTLAYSLETSPTLAPGGWTGSGYTERPVTDEFDPDYDKVVNDIATPGGAIFIRLGIVE
jgi:arylsulfatase A-like enzyme